MTEQEAQRLKELEGYAEQAYADMYDARNESAAYSEAKECFYAAIAYARSVSAADEIVQRLERRLAQIKGVFRSQMG